jgi:hypothetical protein
MKTILKLMLAALMIMSCHYVHAAGKKADDSTAMQMLGNEKKAKKLEGATLKIAKTFLKKTPMSVVMDDIEAMLICPLEKSDDVVEPKVEQVLKSYTKVSEIDDSSYMMYIFIDELDGERFSEIILYTTRPDKSIMVFCGDFTVEALMKVGELSEQQRKKRLGN